jgi:DUF4097 and DUF4098 domain-containing protein YvlB
MASFSPPSHAAFSITILRALLAVGLTCASQAEARHHFTPAHSGAHLTSEVNGAVAAHEGDRIRLAADLGSVVVHAASVGKSDVRYRIRLEADAAQKDAVELLKSFTVSAHETSDGVLLTAHAPGRQSTGRLWATIELTIPKKSSLDVSTGGGNIDADDVGGRAVLSTAGGNITAGNISGTARFETGGGNIVAQSAGGELIAETGGGHITIGSVGGNASVHTSGGHIRVTSIQGTAHLSTGGGNITLERSRGELSAETGGGEIEVGEAGGLVRAKTGGGGIRVVRMLGPTDLQTLGGSIYLTQVDSPVKASTAAGGITAWCVGSSKAGGPIDLQSSAGDIIVHIPRELALTIDARIQMGGDHQLIVDPAFPLKLSYDDPAKGTRAVRAEGALNGGGQLLRLRTIAGSIQLLLSDTGKQAELYKQQMEKIEQRIQAPAENSGATNDDLIGDHLGDIARSF